MNIVVLVKQVPDTYAERKLRSSDGALDWTRSTSALAKAIGTVGGVDLVIAGIDASWRRPRPTPRTR